MTSSFSSDYPYYHSLLLNILDNNAAADIWFQFPNSNGTIRAHRIVLLQYPFYRSLRKESSVDLRGFPYDFVDMSGYCLLTFKSLLRYLYTGDIVVHSIKESEAAAARTPLDTTMVLSSLPPPPYDADTSQEPVHQHATVSTSLSGEDDLPVDKNEDAWFELLKLAAKFKIEDLRIKCRDRILSTVTKDNAIRILFTVGYRFSDMKEPIMKILVSHYRELFPVAESSLALEDQDNDCESDAIRAQRSDRDWNPFAPYSSHSRCVQLMGELMARAARELAQDQSREQSRDQREVTPIVACESEHGYLHEDQQALNVATSQNTEHWAERESVSTPLEHRAESHIECEVAPNQGLFAQEPDTHAQPAEKHHHDGHDAQEYDVHDAQEYDVHDAQQHHDGHDAQQHHDGHDAQQHHDGHDAQQHHDGHNAQQHYDGHDAQQHYDGHDAQEHVPWEHNVVQAFDNMGYELDKFGKNPAYELDKFGKNTAYELDKFGKNTAYELDKFGKNVANFFGGW
ncbi:hypothetical protein EC968_006338 [Mortierella alpina]|nr:hypothetical protein EC968_006338 [Mortierella alpina]